MNLEIIVAFGVYFSILGTIGFFAYLRSRKTADFILGSRSLSYWVTALAAHASDMSGWLFMAFPAAVYAHGLIEAWTAVGLVAFMYLNWRFVAPKLRAQTERYHASTLSSFLEQRCNDQTGLIRNISALFCLLFFIFYISANFVALGHLFESIFSISYSTGIFLGALVIFYILLGGYLSIAWVDFFQGMFLLAMIILVPVIAFFTLNGTQDIIHAASTRHVVLSAIPRSLGDFATALLLAIGWGLGYFGQPHIVTKFMGIKDVSEMRKAQRLGLTWQSLTLLAAIGVGLVGLAFFPQGLANPELIFVTMTKQLFRPFFAGLILCAILASAINVIGAQVLASASILAEDFYKHIMRRKPSDVLNQQVQWASRLSVVAICVLSLWFALYNQQKTIYELVYYAWAGLGCSFGPILLLTLHRDNVHTNVALAGITMGGVTAGLWPLVNTTIPAMIVGFAVSVAAMGVVAIVNRR